MNRLELTKEQFEKFVLLPAVKSTYQYFIKDNSEKVDGKIVKTSYEQGIKFGGVEFYVVVDGD